MSPVGDGDVASYWLDVSGPPTAVPGDLGTWEPRNLGTWEPGNLEIWDGDGDGGNHPWGPSHFAAFCLTFGIMLLLCWVLSRLSWGS